MRAAEALDPVRLAARCRLDLDDWQAELVRADDPELLVVASRQSGKSTSVAVKALHKALYTEHSTAVVLAPSQRQSGEIVGKARSLLSRMDDPPAVTAEGELHLRFANGARLLGLPGTEKTVRTFAADLIIVDEAAAVDQSLIEAVRPMLAVSGGQIIAVSTPRGRVGWFAEAWHSDHPWRRWEIPANRCPRIPPDFLARERDALPLAKYRQEYECSFESVEGGLFHSETLDRMFADDEDELDELAQKEGTAA